MRAIAWLLLFAIDPGLASAGAPQERRPEPPAGAPALPLVVEVVDGGGRPVGDVGVSIVLRRHDGSTTAGRPSPRDVEFLSDYLATAASRAQDGRATFDLGLLELHPQEFESLVARLDLPSLDPIEVAFDPKQLPSAPLRLVLPECGSVRIELPGIAKGSVRVRAFDDGDATTIWNRRAPDRHPIVDGVAQIALAAVGVELEYVATWDGLGTPLTGHFHGPTRAGEEMRFAPPTLASYPRVTGRVLDDELNPVANRAIRFDVSISQKGKSSRASGETTTDAGGRFDFALVAELLPGGRRELSVHAAAPKEGERDFGEADALVDLSKKPPAGPLDAGDVVLVPPGSLRWLARQSDDELEKAYEMRKSTSGTRRRDIEACLVEMGRRKSERWKKYLTAELAAARPAKEKKGRKERDPDAAAFDDPADDFALLTALRRAQGKSDPLAVEIVGPPPFDAMFPATPTIGFRLKNVDAAKEGFGVTEGGSYRSGRFARIHVEAKGPDGAHVPVVTRFGMGLGGGISRKRILAAGETMGYELALGDFVDFPSPGNYQLRISYHDSEEIADEERIEGYVVVSSAEFTVRLKSQPITVRRADLDLLKQRFDAIDFTKKVPLVSGHWRADMKFKGPSTTPEDEIFRAGFIALPMLFERLEDESLSIEQKSWAFGLLWDITGLNNPAAGEFQCAVKDPEWIRDWPTSFEESPLRFDEFGKTSGGGWPDHQKGLAARWKSIRSWFDIKVVK